MSYYNKDNPYQSSYPQTPPTPKHTRYLLTLVLCLTSALVGGLVSVGVAPSIYANKTSSQTSSPVILNQASTKPIKLDYNSTDFPVVDIAKNVGPAVVNISNFQSNAGAGTFGWGFEAGNSSGNSLVESGSGSGFIIDAQNGYIVTNNHVIDGAKKLVVNLPDGRNVDAKVVGADPRTDLAVIKISDTSNLTAVTIGDSSKLQVGEPVVAIGNPGGEAFAGSVTTGVVSATNRILDIEGESSFNLIQTDAAINPGNSGGPLVNYLGQVIGINSAKYAQTGFEGMGFAIPITDAMPTIQQLIQKGYASHAGLNVQVANQYTPEYASQKGWPAGAYILQVISGGAADQAGLQQGDIITKVNDVTISDSTSLTHELFKYKPGDKVNITYYRNGSTKNVTVALVEIKD
ncbi:trypsin-like peptidase domain-containing protein [Desulfosporosinus sp. PR]|uniref:S1C family serine protease n=1 Tax=Candidatus Desulfosporosinus nitrosoreducens TaxID=3401928 RepID=UPI0027F2E227|nr:trypsin-like peptidase domain-containing protein [Desulfosporosinus sp. PR]MDQ7097095.1 trypsin-like peptidase domain-containing protein [Desulfosporosinus sp. PR]